jgi:hypothetical protein
MESLFNCKPCAIPQSHPRAPILAVVDTGPFTESEECGTRMESTKIRGSPSRTRMDLQAPSPDRHQLLTACGGGRQHIVTVQIHTSKQTTYRGAPNHF